MTPTDRRPTLDLPHAAGTLGAMPNASAVKARALLVDAPGRVTQPRIAVLAALLDADHPESHADLQRRLPDLDRVSLYRSLDWLCDQHLAFKLTGNDGVRRYGRSEAKHEHQAHPHFQCTRCGVTECLPQAAVPAPHLPRGYRLDGTDVIARGLCPRCRKA